MYSSFILPSLQGVSEKILQALVIVVKDNCKIFIQVISNYMF